MAQLSLFSSAPGVVADDERGRIVYTPGFVSSLEAEEWFAELMREVAWSAERRWMYDREVDVPRLTARFRLGPGADPRPPASILAAAARVTGALSVPFNSVGLNLYRDGQDSVAAHNDHLGELAPGHPIALLSLGGPRRMTIRAKQPPRRVLSVDLESGSLLVMSYATQVHYVHAVPKTDEPVAARISLALRVRPDAPEAGPPARY